MEMGQTMCTSCRKTSPEYYEMKLQIRFRFFEEKDIMKLKEDCMNILTNNFPTINKIDEVDDGFEVFFRDHRQMNKAAQLFGRKWLIVDKRSSKIMGQDKMTQKSLYRHTQQIVLVNIGIKDEVMIKGVEYWIKAINKGGQLVLREIKTGDKKVISYEMVQDYFKLLKKYQKPELVEE